MMLIRFIMLSTTVAMMMAARPAMAIDVIGPIYTIKEPNALHEIQAKLKAKEASGELAKLQQEMVDKTKKTVAEPKPVAGLLRTQVARSWYLDPTYRLTNDIKDAFGNVLFKNGTTVNPLDFLGLRQNWLFFDATDTTQITRAKQLLKHYDGKLKLILVQGKPFELSKEWQLPVFFDQGGTLIRRFGIKAVPAILSQENKRLRVDEIQ